MPSSTGTWQQEWENTASWRDEERLMKASRLACHERGASHRVEWLRSLEAPLDSAAPREEALRLASLAQGTTRFGLPRGRRPFDSLRSLRAPLDSACHEGGLRESAGRIEWCGRGDSNPHGIATASPSSWCVCQFRHFREKGRHP